jgi:uncharacterized repeat protein (TIGR02543 family)
MNLVRLHLGRLWPGLFLAVLALSGCGGGGASTGETVNNTPQAVTTSVTVNRNNAGGTVTSVPSGINCGTDCGASYTAGTSLTLHAEAASGYVFAGWTGVSGCGSAPDCVASLQGATLTAVATFSPQAQAQYQLQLTVAASGGGSVSSQPGGLSACSTACAASFNAGTSVTLIATPAGGYVFSGWSVSNGACTGSSPTCQVDMSAARSVTANFTAVPPVTHRLTVAAPANGLIGSTSPLPAGINCGVDCTEDYADGTSVTLQATPTTSGFAFGSWGGDCAAAGNASTCTLNLSADRNVSANFIALPPNKVALTVATLGTGSGTVTSAPAGISCGASCSASFDQNSSVTLTAAPAAGSSFAGWTGDCTGASATCTLSLASARNVAATFTRITYALTVSKSGLGTVSSSPAGIDCGTTCSTSVVAGSSLTLTATPATGYNFAGWSGACAGTTGSTCTVTVNAATSVTANFTQPRSLTVTSSAGGAVGSSPAGIACPGTCSASFTDGTTVTLVATPTSGYSFTGWSGACTGTGSCVVTLAANATVSAAFTAIPPTTYALNVAAATGGSVSSTPAGISCGSSCTSTFNAGTSVSLTATPQTGYSFSGWSGGGCAALTNPCVLALNANTTVSAAFTPVNRTLTLGKSGTGSGTLTSSPAGLSCGATCSAAFAHGTSVTLSAAAASGSSLGSWTGACAGTTGSTCTVVLTADTSVGVSFTLNPSSYLLTLAKSGSGSGTVSSSPAGISCGSTCSASFSGGTSVTLTAAAASGSSFAGWTGACAGVGSNTCTVAVNAALSVGASFNLASALDCAATNVRCVSSTAGANQEYATIQAAANAVVAGDTVLVFAGTYTGFTVSRSGSSTQAIRFLANDGNVIIGHGGNSELDGVRLQNVNYVTIEGFVIRNTASSSPRIHRCIAARGATADAPMTGNVMRNNQCIDADAEGLYASQFGNGLIEGNTISGSGKNGAARMHGIYLANAGSDGTVIRGNSISNNPNAESEGIHINGDSSIGGDGLVSNLVIEGNRITGSGNNGLNFDGVQDSLIRNNIVYGNGHHALRAYAADGAAGPRNMRVVNNTFDASAGWAVKFTEDVGGHVLFNNILLGTSGGLVVGTTANVSSNYNVVQGSFSTDGEATVVNLATWRSRTGQDAASLASAASALFTNAGAADYSLKVGSPARDMGVASFASVSAPATDFARAARPRGTAYDAGALEAAP